MTRGGTGAGAGADDAIPALVAAFPLLAGLDPLALAELGIADDPIAVAGGDSLFRQNDPSDGLYLIASGGVRLEGRTPGDGRVALATVGPGEMVGEFSLLDGGPRSASAIATGPVSGYRIGLDRFAALSISGQPAALAIMDRLRIEVAERTRATVADIAAELARGAGAPRAAPRLPLDPCGQPVTAAELSGWLASFPGWDALSAADWAALAAVAQRLEPVRGTLLGDLDTPVDHLFIVARGAVRVSLPHPAGGVEQLLLHGPGSFSGVAALMDAGPRPFVHDVREDAVLLAIGCEAFAMLRHGTSRLGRLMFAAIGLQMVRDMRRLSRQLGRIRSPAAGGQG